MPVDAVGNGYVHTSPKHVKWRVKTVIGVLLVKNYKVINGVAINRFPHLCQALQAVVQEANLSEFAVRLKVEHGTERCGAYRSWAGSAARGIMRVVMWTPVVNLPGFLQPNPLLKKIRE